MIKIKPYTELPQKEEIFNLYLYLASKAMPFYPEDVFLEGYCFPDGHSKTALSIYKSERKPRRRTESYKSILKKYRIPQGDTAEKKIKCDALLAKKIIRANSKELYKFMNKILFDVVNIKKYQIDVNGIKKIHLHFLKNEYYLGS